MMKYMIQNEGKIKFVCSIITAWHLIGLKSYLLKLKEENNNTVEGIVFIEKHPVNGYLIKDDMLDFGWGVICHCVYGSGTDSVLRELANYHSFESDFHVITPCFPEIILCNKIMRHFSVKAKAIVLDEGVGSYDTSLLRWAKSVMIDTKSLRDSLHFVGRYFYQRFLKAYKRIKVENFMLFKDNSGELSVDEDVVRYYTKLMNQSAGGAIEVEENRYILFFTNPLEEEGNVIGDDLINIYNEIVSICEARGYSVLFRLHPRETLLDKYKDFKIITSQASSSEDLLNRLEKKPAYVIGAHSTSLVTAKLFFDIQAITIGKILYNYSRTDYCKHLIDKYNKNFSSVVYIPSSLEEIDNILTS